MAASAYSIVPRIIQKSATTTAGAIYSQQLLVPAFIIQANASNTGVIRVGASNLGTAANGIALNARESISFDPFKRDREQSSYYDLNQFFVRSYAAGTYGVTVMVLDKDKDNP
jgi:hypothetical protein